LALGDSKNNFAVLDDLLRKVDGKVDFAVFLGDATGANAAGQAYFREEMRKLDLAFPVFYVPGNNDFRPEAKNAFQGAFTLDDFERTYGPPLFSFEHGGDLFIGICSVGNAELDSRSLEFLKSLEGIRKRSDRCFVFEHIPPKGVPGYDSGEFQADPRFAEEFERLGVDYVFASHFHGFQEVESGGVEYIVTGGAGAPFDDPDGTGQAFHAVEFTVSPDFVKRRLVFASSGASWPVEMFESLLAREALPFLRFHQSLLWILGGVCAASWVAAARLARSWRRRPDAVGIAAMARTAYIGELDSVSEKRESG
jgi:hypothetical protein